MEKYLMINLNIKTKMIKSIYMSIVNHTRGHYDFKCLLAKLFEYKDIMTQHNALGKKEIKLLLN